MNTITDYLAKHPLIFDGAMGTELQKRGLHQDPALLNLTHPNAIIDIHKEYLAAGSNVLTANTFGAYSHKHNNAKELIKAAISHGHAAIGAQPDKWLALDLGPTGLMLEPYGNTTEEECQQIFSEAVEIGASCNIDLVLVETMMDLTELKLAVSAAKQANLPVFATMSFDKTGRTMMGASLADMVSMLEELDICALGMNCGFGPDIYAMLAEELSKLTKLPIIIQPNAGIPVPDETAKPGPSGIVPVRYNLTPEDFAAAMVAMNVDILGGCCGTTPQHIAALTRRM